MNSPDYYEPVRLLVPFEEPRALPLAEAVLAALQIDDRVKRVGATILREGGEPIGHAEIIALYDRSDFPKERDHRKGR
jgi:hypothetical protein